MRLGSKGHSPSPLFMAMLNILDPLTVVEPQNQRLNLKRLKRSIKSLKRYTKSNYFPFGAARQELETNQYMVTELQSELAAAQVQVNCL